MQRTRHVWWCCVFFFLFQACSSKIAVRPLNQDTPCAGGACPGNGNVDNNTDDNATPDTDDPNEEDPDPTDPDPVDTSCAWDRPLGDCPEGLVCDEGVCEVPVGSLYCSAENVLGACVVEDWVFRPDRLEPVRLTTVCCDEEKVSTWGCALGTCASEPCSADALYGLCGAGQYCKEGVCADAPCGPSFQTGACEQSDQMCVNGRCTKTQCVGKEAGYCGTEVCDEQRNVCVRAYCSEQALQGLCLTPNTVCCNEALHASDACVLGTCITPSCQRAYPGGSCPEGQVCSNGRCAPRPCSPLYPEGACGPGFECLSGGCVRSVCSAQVPQGACPAGQRCASGGVCAPYVCSEVFPQGPCAQSGQVCEQGVCRTPACSAQYPGGACEEGFVCSSGTCKAQPCSVAYPQGVCGAGFVCNNGRCAVAACSSEHPEGLCLGNDAGKKCVQGVCASYTCSSAFPEAPCPVLGEVCTAGVCEKPECSALYPNGHCNDTRVPAHDVCINGACERLPCSADILDGTCPSAQICCDSVVSTSRGGCTLGSCVRDVCSEEAPNGYCAGSQRCKNGACVDYVCAHFPQAPCPVSGDSCVEGVCVRPACDLFHPAGTCLDPSEVCLSGQCVVPSCSALYPQGTCPLGRVCTDGACVAVACSESAPTGACPTGQRCHDGVCRSNACSMYFPTDGVCSAGYICTEGACVRPPCNSTYPGGACENTEAVCVNGTCVRPGCSTAALDGDCPSGKVCCNNTLQGSHGCTLGQCINTPCAPSTPTGACVNSDEICCTNALHAAGSCSSVGTCIPALCNSTFTSGACVGSDAGKTCVAGVCQFLCTPDHPTGWCPSQFNCVEGTCRGVCTNDMDCDTVSNTHEGNGDADGDGAPNKTDRDSDNDGVDDMLESGDRNIATAPIDTDNDGVANAYDEDSDNDHISDALETGASVLDPVDTDHDGVWDMLDTDSDGDGILDRCEVSEGLAGLCSAVGIVDYDTGLSAVLDSDADGVRDYLDTDSDDDGVLDTIEARTTPHVSSTFLAVGVDHDNANEGEGGVKTPDYRDEDSDNDGVLDADEDVNGDGVVNCQQDGSNQVVTDTRTTPVCNGTVSFATAPFAPGYVYNYNPGCLSTPAAKCLLAESSRVHPDTDGDAIADQNDGVYRVCSDRNLKPINVFYSSAADYALALEEPYTQSRVIRKSSVEVGLAFNSPSNTSGAYAVAGFVLKRVPHATAMAVTGSDAARVLINKALAQETVDRSAFAQATGISQWTFVINKNFTSFDGYGAVVSRYKVTTSSSVSVALLRDRLMASLDGTLTNIAQAAAGPSSTDFTVFTETLYRYDNGTTGAVVLLLSVVPTSSPASESYNYRPRCSERTVGNCVSAGLGCQVSSNACVDVDTYQPPVFYAENMMESSITQYGDGLSSYCQSMVQVHSPLDVLWVVDNSGSMAEEINQVLTSSNLFFGLLNRSESDYRVAQTTTASSSPLWEPTSSHANPSSDENARINGSLIGGFTGSVAGVTSASTSDREGWFDCSAYPDNCNTYACGGDLCCPECQLGDGLIYSPACYFASRLPCDDGSGREFGMLMGAWALYMGSSSPVCASASGEGACGALQGCVWQNNRCEPGYCALPTASNTIEECNGNSTSYPPVGSDNTGDELEPGTCEWSSVSNACVPSYGVACSSITSSASCKAPECAWTGSACRMKTDRNFVFCDASTESACQALGSGWCVWNASSNTCHAPDQYAFRSNTEKILVVIGDEEDCYVKDHNYSNDCEFLGYGLSSMGYQDPVRIARTQAYTASYQSRGVTVYAITGDKANPSLPASASNGGCYTGNVMTAEAGQAYVDVAEGTGGGWGSICAPDLYPTIESVIVGALGASSAYRLEGSIAGRRVQPIASTIKVAVETCTVSSEYPSCASGKTVRVVPRSRENGFDFDAKNNTLVLYGNARAASSRDIVVSYRYFVDHAQPPSGNTSCPCPATSSPGCACPAGQRCGRVGEVDYCGAETTALLCNNTPGCTWNTANGGVCIVNGLCEADPTCGGGCGTGELCNAQTGLCECDVGCGDGCEAGLNCDYERSSATCGTCVCDTTCGGGCAPGLTCDSVEASATCGQCLCDTSCGGGCPVGQRCNNNVASLTCGSCEPAPCPVCASGFVCDRATASCVCDTSCGGCPQGKTCDSHVASETCGQCLCDITCGGCPEGQECDSNLLSANCGLCQVDPTCGGTCGAACGYLLEETCVADSACRWVNDACHAVECKTCTAQGLCIADTTCCGGCADNEQCNALTGRCECDASCDGGCALNQTCANDPSLGVCGQCMCDTTCGGCPVGQVCDSDVNSLTCGVCSIDATCGGCDFGCLQLTDALACEHNPECQWGDWAEGGLGECHPYVWQVCDASLGLCRIDPTCNDACSAFEWCNSSTGQCECDVSCGGGCASSQTCDDEVSSATCGQCLCDTTCSGGCPSGQLCNNTEGPRCGVCEVDPTCGGGCPTVNGVVRRCNSSTGVCEADPTCGGACNSMQRCNAATGQCVCDTFCDFACGSGSYCDNNLSSSTCGACVCDTDCGNGCPQGLLCDNNAGCEQWNNATVCAAVTGCGWNQEIQQCVSATCGQCVVDPTCGGCAPGLRCNVSTGICEASCPTCSTGRVCDAALGQCVCRTDCGGGCDAGTVCDDNPSSATCGQCLCDTACGEGCPGCQVCDDRESSNTCGQCITPLDCGGGCGFGQVCDAFSGCCVTDPNCGGLCPENFRCDPLTWECIPSGG
jgi:hypothetical protein